MKWEAGSKAALRVAPKNVRWVFGRALYQAQLGKRPPAASPMKGRLLGVIELRTEERGDAYRLYYTMKCPGWVYVLYRHKKKSKRGIRIPRHEEDLILSRYRQAMRDCREAGE